ncbi:MAG: quinone-dependent dihydroorotate dehydrogenase [Patescibacteria group bacterium]|nr:quinone-dependent dihydroorotate dehydrogenase [Patescibacteria group bacterium]
MSIHKKIVSPILDRLDSEYMHTKARETLHIVSESTLGIGMQVLKRFAFQDPRLQITVEGITFDNPVLVGAGWDKYGEAVRGLLALGFGGVEVGTVPEHPQNGNPKPRQFMIADGVAINRLGFNSPGMEKVAHILNQYKGENLPIGISLGQNKDVTPENAAGAHARVMDRLYEYGKYFVINVSSPNTPGLRGLQSKKPLTEIVKAVLKAMKTKGRMKPLFVKIAPDLENSAIDDVIEVVKETGISGIIATNTTLDAKYKGKYAITDSRILQVDESGKKRNWGMEMGGLSGDDAGFRNRSTEIIRYIYTQARKKGVKLIIIGVGGVKDGPTAVEKIKAGASLVQVVTAIRGEGPAVAGNINRGIVKELKMLGLSHVAELVGYDVKKSNGK